uniref:EF-hand domain-containing protein n=1 Tax=Timema bartmani TaxID=61472 RepID=A0A7R9I1E0_9NEOP|nr:unnamed protein product [Timema bartmani]
MPYPPDSSINRGEQDIGTEDHSFLSTHSPIIGDGSSQEMQGDSSWALGGAQQSNPEDWRDTGVVIPVIYHMASYSEDQLAEFQEAFQLFDSRGDGKIHVTQIGDVLRALGQNPTESDVKKFTHQHKPDERISFEVFLPIYQAISKGRTSDTADDFIEGLRHFDKDGNGFISSAELRHLLSTLGEKLTDEEVEQLLAGQEDSQGNINYEEFVRMVMCG